MTAAASLPVSLQGNARLSTWLRVDPAGFIEVRSGKVEFGQGILTALAQIAAEELDVAFERIRMVPADTVASPDEAITSGSLSIQQSGSALRHVCAQARALLLDKAAHEHGMPAHTLRVIDGVIHAVDRRLATYWELADHTLLDCNAWPRVALKARTDYTLVGTIQARPDIAEKVYGRFRFIHDLALPGMAHGRMVRPPSPAAELLAWDAETVASWNGVLTVARDGSLAGVVAETEALAEKAAAALAKSAQWREHPTLPDVDDLPAWLKTLRTVDMRLGNAMEQPLAPSAADTLKTFRAAYSKPFIKHGSIGPSCALAVADGDTLEVWSHTQGIFNLRKDLSLAFDMPETAIVVRHVQGAGCYGHNGADDVAYDAAWLARHCPGRPIRVQWSRADELNWSPHGPPMAIELQAQVDSVSGRIVSWRHELWSAGHGLRPGRAATPTLLGSWYRARPFERLHSADVPRAAGGGGDRNAEPIYRFATTDVLCHRVLDVPLRTSSLRALGAYANVFAIESFMDELAHAAKIDPLAYRLAHLTDARAIAVLKKAAGMANWENRVGPWGEGRGRGLGFARYKNTSAYCAVVADVEVQERVRVHRLWIAVDVGLVVNPDGVRQQIEGGALQAVSWTLMEAARFDHTRLLGENWEHYPMLRFSQVPDVDIAIVRHAGDDPVGAGEGSLGPTAAAIGNAVFDALGVRVRDLPLTPEHIVGAMED